MIYNLYNNIITFMKVYNVYYSIKMEKHCSRAGAISYTYKHNMLNFSFVCRVYLFLFVVIILRVVGEEVPCYPSIFTSMHPSDILDLVIPMARLPFASTKRLSVTKYMIIVSYLCEHFENEPHSSDRHVFFIYDRVYRGGGF